MREEPKWVSADHVQRLHDRAIQATGGAAGVRDKDLLESAVARPQNLYAYEGETDHFQLAASYAEGIAKNHPFVDGNKRSAFLTADLFLSCNGYSLDATPHDRHAEKMVALAEGTLDRAQFAHHLSEHSVRIEQTRTRTSPGDRLRRFRDQLSKTRDDDRER